MAHGEVGIGGEMAEIKAGIVAAKKAGAKRARRVVDGPKRLNGKFVAGSGLGEASGKQETEKMEGRAAVEAKPEKKKRGNGLKRLEKAADQRLGSASETLADLLLEKAQAGKVDSTLLLVKLAERKTQRKPQEKKKKKRPGPSFAELLASEPEWVEEKPEVGDVWVGDGWKNEKTGRFVPAPR